MKKERLQVSSIEAIEQALRNIYITAGVESLQTDQLVHKTMAAIGNRTAQMLYQDQGSSLNFQTDQDRDIDEVLEQLADQYQPEKITLSLFDATTQVMEGIFGEIVEQGITQEQTASIMTHIVTLNQQLTDTNSKLN